MPQVLDQVLIGMIRHKATGKVEKAKIYEFFRYKIVHFEVKKDTIMVQNWKVLIIKNCQNNNGIICYYRNRMNDTPFFSANNKKYENHN